MATGADGGNREIPVAPAGWVPVIVFPAGAPPAGRVALPVMCLIKLATTGQAGRFEVQPEFNWRGCAERL